MKNIACILIIFGLQACGNNSLKNKPGIKTKIDNSPNEINLQSFDGVVKKAELSVKFDSIRTLYEEYNERQLLFDTLMVFKKNKQDTLISKSEVQFLESFDPNAAYYLFNSDTIIGGNGYCSSIFYLLKKGKLVKVISQYADCVESSSSTRQELYLNSDRIKLFYYKDVEDVWDEGKFEKGIEGSETEIYATFDSGNLQLGIQKRIVKYRLDMKISDTMIFEFIDYNDLRFLLPEIGFGFEN